MPETSINDEIYTDQRYTIVSNPWWNKVEHCYEIDARDSNGDKWTFHWCPPDKDDIGYWEKNGIKIKTSQIAYHKQKVFKT